MLNFRKSLTFVSIIIFITCDFTFTQDKKIDCENAVTQMEMNFCAKQSYEKVQKELDKIYAELVKVIKEKQQYYEPESQITGKKLIDGFIDSQNHWKEYRDSAAEFNGSIYQGGSMQPLIYFNAMARITEDRIKELKNLLEEFSL